VISAGTAQVDCELPTRATALREQSRSRLAMDYGCLCEAYRLVNA
jgi:hypothetical protein